MDLPRWNSEWDPPDPLKGRRGWGRHHYATAAVFALLLAGAAGLAAPAALQFRRVEAEEGRVWDRQREAREEAISGSIQPP